MRSLLMLGVSSSLVSCKLGGREGGTGGGGGGT